MKLFNSALATTLTVFALSTPAFATIYSYDATIGNGIGDTTISVDSVSGKARFTGSNIDLTLNSESLKGFEGVTGHKTFKSDSVSGTFTRNGTTYDAFQSTTPKHTKFSLGNDFSFLWTYGTGPDGSTFDFDGKGNLTFTGTTPSGGTTPDAGTPDAGTPDAGNPGGGSVPVPATLFLVLAGLAGMGAASRRRKPA